MRISAAAMRAALEDLKGLMFQTRLASACESFLVAKRLAALGKSPPQVSDANAVVQELFVFFPDHATGRLYPFRWDWKESRESGRKTVWDNTTRGRANVASGLFTAGDLRQGLVANAAAVLRSAADGLAPPGGSNIVVWMAAQSSCAGLVPITMPAAMRPVDEAV